jgi:hypothetical protein
MKIKTAELTGAALDWAVAKCEGVDRLFEAYEVGRHHYSTDWAQGGPIIEREMREFGFDLWSGTHIPHGQFAATYCRGAQDSYVYGETPLIAAMRCYVASKLGDEFDVPDELCQA